jgi:hypothetical protein
MSADGIWPLASGARKLRQPKRRPRGRCPPVRKRRLLIEVAMSDIIGADQSTGLELDA